MLKIIRFLNKHFHINAHNSSVKTEIMAGVTNYFTIIYLLILVPEIIIGAFPGAISQDGDMNLAFILENGLTVSEMLVSVTAACFIAAGIGSIVMGILTNLPFVQGPSLAISTFVTYTVCRSFGYTYNQALALIFISGLCFFVLAIFGMEKKIHKAIPNNLKYAVTAGIGMLIAFSGIKKAYILSYPNSSGVSHLFNMTDFSSYYTKTAYLAIIGIIFIAILLKKHIHGAIFIGKIVCIFLAIPLGLIKLNSIEQFTYTIKFSEILFKLDFNGLFDFSSTEAIIRTISQIIIVLFAICMMDIFETMTMLITVDNFIDISKEGIVEKRIPQILEIDALTTSFGASVGATAISTYVESTTGIVEGGRTGLTAIITGVLFLLSITFVPIVSLIPSAATATTLFVGGVLIMNIMKRIDFEDPAEAIPAFFTMFLMPLAESILIGIAFGIISYTIIHLFLGKTNKLNKTIYVLSVIFFITLFYIP